MKLVILLSRFPYPLDKGDKLRAYYFIKYLSARFEIHLVCISEEAISIEQRSELELFCKSIKIIRQRRFQTFINLIRGCFNRLPFQVNYFTSPAAIKEVETYIKEINPHKLLVQLARMAEYVNKFPVKDLLIDYQDAFSKIMNQRALQSKWPIRKIFEIEAKRMAAYEQDIFERFSVHLIISESDKKALKLHKKNKNEIMVIPNGVETSFFHENSDPFPNRKFDVFFAGNMSYPPNVQAATFLVKKIMPLVWSKKPNVSVLLLGTNPDYSIQKLACEKVIVSGWVEDVRPWYASSTILVAPMLSGAGLQNKLLQAMAMKIACITTPLANAALNAINRKQILVGETATEIAEEIILLLENTSLRNQIAQQGQEFVIENFSWQSALKKIN